MADAQERPLQDLRITKCHDESDASSNLKQFGRIKLMMKTFGNNKAQAMSILANKKTKWPTDGYIKDKEKAVVRMQAVFQKGHWLTRWKWVPPHW